MSYGMMCNQRGCKEYARYRYTWPGQNEAGICEGHWLMCQQIANAMGLPLQGIPLTDADHKAAQKATE